MALAIIVGMKRKRRRQARDLALERKYLRDFSNVFDMPEQEFLSNFRMDKHCFKYIMEEIKQFICPTKSTGIPPIIKLSSFLRFLASGSHQKCLGDEYVASMSQVKMSQVISELLDTFERHICPKYICFEMSEHEELTIKEKFYEKFGLPGVIGCVDGTHIKIKAPAPARRHLYYNGNGYYSLNAMIICDFDMIIRFVDARAQGATPDAYVWRTSMADEILKTAYRNGKRDTWLLGDSGYQLLPYLLTPYQQPQNAGAVTFNTKLWKAHSTIERCFSTLKNRFRVLINEKGLHYSPDKCTQIVNACCALHNICIVRKNIWEYTEMSCEETPMEDVYIYDEDTSEAGVSIRDELARDII